MKKILAMCLLMPSLVFANPQMVNRTSMCVNGEDLTKTVNEFKEIPYVRGLSTPFEQQGIQLSLVVFLNPTTGTFTVVEKADDNLYCILAVGGGFEPVPKKIQDNVIQEQEKSTL